MKEPWYVKSFQEDYLKIYAHRTDEAAEQEMKQIVQLLDMPKGSRVLDLCCGNGRHSRQLAKLDYQVTGIDLSHVLLDEARKANFADKITYLQSDVRELSFEEEFDYVLNLFTSFGYFEQVEENQKVFQAIYRALKGGGVFLIDFLNPGYIRKNLVPESYRESGELKIREKRRIEKNQVIKDIHIEQEGAERQYQEKVNLFEYEEMVQMLQASGLTTERVYGAFDLQPYDEADSPRMILIGKK
ncbi:class I SAM-dependent methyltransferase [Caldalkalibacillus mannanilyticus]|uniref:class I SAM-dependent methyltransferase n=1 Tax=Caldalkalibacillus mannanilyticus TaxID=1418 RepID=UPI000468963D|nr:class I SAM-dependent methyltransferase [Caldalkalibacillus mannanilyticus]